MKLWSHNIESSVSIVMIQRVSQLILEHKSESGIGISVSCMMNFSKNVTAVKTVIDNLHQELVLPFPGTV